MKKTFPEFTRPTTDELKELWENAVIVFDTSVLLNLYEYSQNTRDGIFKIIEKLKKQLWLPYKICEEFYTKRISVIHKTNNAPDTIISKVDELLNTDDESCLYGLFHDNKQLKKIKKEAEKISKQNKLEISADEIVDKIEKIYEGRVGQEFKPGELVDIEKEYQDKVKNGIYCPGFKDAAKESNSSGDFCVWKQILAYAIKNNKSIIFVTEDGKQDWWWKPQGHRISARYELLKEFNKATSGKKFHMYKMKDFTQAYEKYKGAKVDKKVVEEIKSNDAEKAVKSVATQALGRKLLNDLDAYKKAIEPYEKMRDSFEGYNKLLEPYRNMKKYEDLFADLRNPMNPWIVPESMSDHTQFIYDRSKHLLELLGGNSVMHNHNPVIMDSLQMSLLDDEIPLAYPEKATNNKK